MITNQGYVYRRRVSAADAGASVLAYHVEHFRHSDEDAWRQTIAAGRVRVKGRGGTVLQPGIDLLQNADDFPKSGPILVITDGFCDKLQIRRDHAFLVPAGHGLPFRPLGPVFWVR